MIVTYRKAMDALYLLCVAVAGTSLVLISAVIPWAVYTRYVINSAASWPEPTAVLLTIVLTFFGAAACYRRRQHMNVAFFVDLLPPAPRRIANLVAEGLMGAVRGVHGDLGREARRGDLEQHDRRLSRAVRRRHLPADPARRRCAVPVRHRALLIAPPLAAAPAHSH